MIRFREPVAQPCNRDRDDSTKSIPVDKDFYQLMVPDEKKKQ